MVKYAYIFNFRTARRISKSEQYNGDEWGGMGTCSFEGMKSPFLARICNHTNLPEIKLGMIGNHTNLQDYLNMQSHES